MRKICVVTGTRAEYGLLYWLLKEIKADKELQLQLVVTGMHLSPEFGLTYKTIEADGFMIDAKVEMLLSSDTPVGISKSIGLGVIGLAEAFSSLKPDVVLLLGDRFEILSAAQAAMIARIPIAHIHGGEATEGLIDEAIRHSVTKMSHIHFVASEVYRNRVVQLGEAPERVFNFEAPGLDNLARLKLMNRAELEKSIGFKLGELNFLVTYHPVTLRDCDPISTLGELFSALDAFSTAKVIITKPNADTNGRGIIQAIDKYAHDRPERVMAFTSLGQLRYLSAIKHVDLVIGNSSSGLVEVPALKKPTIDIGERQKGRLKARSVISCGETSKEIKAAMRKALSHDFQRKLNATVSLYGACNASVKIKNCLKKIRLDGILLKKFYDLNGIK